MLFLLEIRNVYKYLGNYFPLKEEAFIAHGFGYCHTQPYLAFSVKLKI